jgi:hypothetical protein
MWWVMLGHLGIPFVFGVAFVVFATASSRNAPTWDIALETALDLAVLGIGATGSIFENETIAKAFGGHAAVVGIAVIGVNFLLSSVIVLVRRFVYEHTPRKLLWGSFSISIGFLCLLVTSMVLAYAYRMAAAVTDR